MAKQKKTYTPKKEAQPSLHVSFSRTNYYIMIAGMVVLVLGYVLMSGGKQEGPNFNPDEIYSFTRVTLAPILVVLGFVIELVAIFYRPKSETTEEA